MDLFKFTEYLDYFWWVVLAIGIAMIVALVATRPGDVLQLAAAGMPGDRLT